MATKKGDVMDRAWEAVQMRTFTRWFNSHLKNGGHKEQITDLTVDLRNGVLLYRLMEQIGGTRLGKVLPNPKLKVQMIQNLNVSLAFINSKVKLYGIAAEDIEAGNLKLILGMIWTLILRFEIASISVEDMSARDGLLLWCQKKTQGYAHVNVKDFTSSWRDGLAFNALIHRHRPDLLDYNALTQDNVASNLEQAFAVAEKDLGINRFLDVNDVEVADERAIMTYLFQFFKVFSGNQKAEMSAKRISKLVGLIQSNEEMQAQYDAKAKELLAWIEKKLPVMKDNTFDNTLQGAYGKRDNLTVYQSVEKPEKAAEKLNIEGVYGTIQMKLRNNKRSPWVPPEEISPATVNTKWAELEVLEAEKEAAIAREIARQEKLEELVRRFNEMYAKLKGWAGEKEQYLAARPVIDTVLTAQSQLKLLDGHNLQYEASKPRTRDFAALGDEIIAMNYRDIPAIQGKMQDITSEWQQMDGLSADKKKWLDQELELQQRMEKLRLQFAECISNLNRWYKDQIESLNESQLFGESLEEVQANKVKVDEKEQALKAQSAEKKGELQKIFAEMEELKIKDNKYTVLRLDDMNAAEKNLFDAIDKYKEAWEAELKRQEAMEAKRKEYAAAAQDFYDFLQELRKQVDALPGEPDPLVEAIENLHQKSEPQHQRLDAVRKIDAECIAMQITHNKYTKFPIPVLEGLSAAFDRYVQSYVHSLKEENAKKLEYGDRAAKLIAWVKETEQTLQDRSADNTLAGIQAKVAEFSRFKSDTKPPKTAEKAAVKTLYESIVKFLVSSPHHRPEFCPPEGTKPEDIAALWKTLEETEKAREEFLDKELARQKKLHAQQKIFHAIAQSLEDWAAKKEKYLTTPQTPVTVQSAQTMLNQLDSYAGEYTAMGSKVEEMNKLHDALTSDNYVHADEISARKQKVEGLWANLKELEHKKREQLNADLKREQQREELRVEFAHLARDFATWVGTARIKLEVREFGDSLEAVRAYRQAKDQEDEQVRSQVTEKQNAIDAVCARMQEANITENEHTTHTQSSLAALKDGLMSVIDARTTAYEKELARQEEMEKKRLEFAQAASAFIDLLKTEHEAIDAMGGDEPAALDQQIKARYSDGALFEQKLQDLERIASEAAQMAITENKHCAHTTKSLRALSLELKKYVYDYSAELEDEQRMKQQHQKAGASLVAWIEETVTKLAVRDWDNTLVGANTKMDQFNDYRASDKAQKVAERKALATLYASIVESLKASSHHRPEFKPDAQHTPEAIDAKMEQLAAAEKDREEALTTELRRQEKLTRLCKEFSAAAKELLQWSKAKEDYLKHEVTVNTVMTAQIQLDLLNTFNTEYEASKPRHEALVKLHDDIVGDNYVDKAAISAKLQEVTTLWSSLRAAADAKLASLKSDETMEVGKEDLRVQFAKLVDEFDAWVRNTTGEVESYAFGNSLEEVATYKETKEKNDTDIKAECAAKKTALDELAAKMTEAGISDNIHSTLSSADVASFASKIDDALAARTASYDKELARQQAMEAKRIEFADAAKEFVQLIDTQKAAIEAVSEGEPEQRAEQVTKILEGGKEAAQTAFTKCVDIDKEAKSMSILDNRHTPESLKTLEARFTVFTKFGQNKLASLAEEKTMKDRKLERQAEWEKKEKLESMKNEYLSQCATLSQWVDGADEIVSSEPKVQSLAEVDSQAAEFKKVQEQLPKNAQLFETVSQLAASLKEMESDMENEKLTGKWNDCLVAIKKRESWLQEQHAVWEKKEAELNKFSEFAKETLRYIEEQKTEPRTEGKSDEEQLKEVVAQEEVVATRSTQLLAELDKITTDMKSNDLPVSRATALKHEIEQLKVIISKRRAVIESQLSRKKFDSTLSDTEVQEIREVFDQFDKDKRGKLKWYEFKGCMAALGDDVEDQQAKDTVAELDADKDEMISFSEFLSFMTKRRTYSDSKDEILSAFKDISGGKNSVSVAQLASVMEPAQVQYLSSVMPKKDDGELDFSAWTERAFV
eukprot:TRINITY_DN5727_c0_g1_i1.p1 TRINITY_DN5727_c0_g1~~TRINITY_DN5727_c0_g1_i1.p1  ORF type:complete len:1988 (-),score=725.31 TRINITY_DN5727_c0_g1_i1:58-6021(-)